MGGRGRFWGRQSRLRDAAVFSLGEAAETMGGPEQWGVRSNRGGGRSNGEGRPGKEGGAAEVGVERPCTF